MSAWSAFRATPGQVWPGIASHFVTSADLRQCASIRSARVLARCQSGPGPRITGALGAWIWRVSLAGHSISTGCPRGRSTYVLGALAQPAAVLDHSMGLWVQCAGLPPSSRKWLLNRLATPIAGCGPSSLTKSVKPSAWAAHKSCLAVVGAIVTCRYETAGQQGTQESRGARS